MSSCNKMIRMKNILSFLTICMIIACEKSGPTGMNTSLSGNYSGTFERTTASGSASTSNVILQLDGKNFSGTSSMPKYPAICNGTYSSTADSLYFTNDCIFTADFDWTLILTKSYSYTTVGDSLYIRRDYANQTTDLYRLKKSN